MYPKVKVRGLEHDDVYDRHYHQASKTALLGLKAFHSLFEGDLGSTGPTLCKTNSLATEESVTEVAPQLVAKVPTGYIPASSSSSLLTPPAPPSSASSSPLLTPAPPPSSDTKRATSTQEKEKEEDHMKQHHHHNHIRASPIPRPRAVLSSPVNDELLGSKTKSSRVERTSRLVKGHSNYSNQSRYSKAKVTPRRLAAAYQSPVNKREKQVDSSERGSCDKGRLLHKRPWE